MSTVCSVLCSSITIKELKKHRERWRGRYKGIELFPYEEQLNRLCLEAWRRGDRGEYKNRIMNSMEEEAGSTKVKANQMKPAGYRF